MLSKIFSINNLKMVDQHRPSTLIGRRQEGLYFPKSSLHSKNISLRLPELMLEALQLLAHKRDVSYQSIIKIFRGKRGLPVFRSGDQAVRTLGKYIQNRLHAREIVLELSTLYRKRETLRQVIMPSGEVIYHGKHDKVGN